jgi:choline dehydrogenase-like flavoprotein
VGQEGAVSDYVVVGAGSAGSVVVRRLLDAGHSVYLIEAGPVDTSPAIHSPQGWPALLGGPLDWGGCSPHRSGTRTIAGCAGRAEGCWVAAVR